MDRKNTKKIAIMVLGAAILAVSALWLASGTVRAEGIGVVGFFDSAFPLGSFDPYAAERCQDQVGGNLCSDLCPAPVGNGAIVPEPEKIPAEQAVAPAPEQTVLPLGKTDGPPAKETVKKDTGKVKPVAAVVKIQKTANPGARIGVPGPIAGKTKVVNGQRVCPKKKDHPAKSKKNKPGHIDAECCLDPDETPNANCYYPPEKYGKLIQKYLSKSQSRKSKK